MSKFRYHNEHIEWRYNFLFTFNKGMHRTLFNVYLFISTSRIFFEENKQLLQQKQ